MNRTVAVLVWLCWAMGLAEAQSCDGASALPARVANITQRAEIVLEDGRSLLPAGIEISDLTLPILLPVLRQGLPAGASLLYSTSAQSDRWGRYVAQVFLPPDGVYGTDWIQETIVAKGFSRALPSGLPADCWTRLLNAEANARQTREGVWQNPDAGPVPATALDRLRTMEGRRSVIFGKLATFGQGRAMIYLNFGEKRYDAFTLMISKRRLKSFERAGMTPAGLLGRQLRMRGVLLGGRQPRMEAFGPEDIELLSESGDGSR